MVSQVGKGVINFYILQAKTGMSYSGNNAAPGGEAPRPERTEPSSPDAGLDSSAKERPGYPMGDEGYQALLEVVLQQTLLAQDSANRQPPEEMNDLLEVARRRKGEAFQADPIGIELVQTVLERPFRSLVASPQQWTALTRQVTQTLCDDAATFDRLRSLWRRLVERCGNGN